MPNEIYSQESRERIAILEPDPRQVDSEVNLIVPNGTYSQESGEWIAP